MQVYATLYYMYKSAAVRTLRLLLFFSLIIWIFAEIGSSGTIKLPLFLFNLFLMSEAYYRFRIAKNHPTVLISENTTDIHQSCTMPLLYANIAHPRLSSFLHELMTLPQVSFLLQRIMVEQKEIRVIEMQKDDLIRYAVELVKTLHGQYITTMDVVAAYLLLSESQTKLLFTKKIKPEEMLQVLYWARKIHSSEEHSKKTLVHFSGGGIGEVLTTGWTLETKKYTRDFSSTALRRPPHLIGRQHEFEMIVETLAKVDNNNILLVGDAGSGKETLVSSLASESYSGNLGKLNYKQFLELMVGPLLAGATDRGDLEVRLQAIIEEISHAGNVVIYIPDFQNILGSSSYGIDLSGALMPYLKGGKLPIIATVTPGNFKTYLEQNPLQEVFTVVKLSEPDLNTTLQMLFEKATDIEEKFRVIISFDALKTAITYASRYVQDGALPGSAAVLLEDVANAVAMNSDKPFGNSRRKIVREEHVVQKIEEKTKIAVAAPTGQEKELLLHLEDKLHERVIDQVQAISAISEAMRRLRSGLTSTTRPISFLFLGPTGVGKTETAKALSELYFGGERQMIRLDMSEYSDGNGVKRLLGAAPGEGNERGELTDKMRDNPFSLILLDEFEKAHPQILDLFLQVLDDGRLTDNKGRTVSFVNSVIIATSNAGSEFIRQHVLQGTAVDQVFRQTLLNFLQQQHVFKPELLNRFDDVVIFKPLGEAEVVQIIQILLDQVIKTLAGQDITVTFDQRVVEKIAKEGTDKQFGARPLRRYIQDNIADLIAQKKLRDEIRRGSTVTVTTDDQDKLIAQIS